MVLDFVLIELSTKVMGLISGDSAVIKSRKRSVEQVCQGLKLEQSSPGDNLFVEKSCVSGRIRKVSA